ncbi:MAG: hypothetical protein NTX22_16265 [Ignavibacteriales bacterium]|nr:hypothetical protein [Ignavibacteriales bacterium]
MENTERKILGNKKLVDSVLNSKRVFKFRIAFFKTIILIFFTTPTSILAQETKKDTAIVTEVSLQKLDATLGKDGFLQLKNFTKVDGSVISLMEVRIYEDILQSVAGKGVGQISDEDILHKESVGETILLFFKNGVTAIRLHPSRTVVEGLGGEPMATYNIKNHPKDENLRIVEINGKDKFIVRIKGKPIEPIIWKR